MGPEIALAASAREWPDRLHRHLLDHGGGRVATRVMGPEQAIEATFEVLLIDDICSFLTPRLVTAVKEKGADVVGVFSPADAPDAKRRLLECGISDVIESEATAPELLQKIAATISHRAIPGERNEPDHVNALSIGITGPTDGVGVTEIAVALAQALSADVDVCLVDLDSQWPSVAQRLDLPLHPNIRTSLDSAMHRPENVGETIHRIGRLSVVGGVADWGRGSPLSHAEVTMLYDSLSNECEVVVADLGAFGRSVKGVQRVLDTLVVVGTGDPVGVARLTRTVDEIMAAPVRPVVLLVINKTPGRRFYESELRREIVASYPQVPTVTLPFDRRLLESMWEGSERKRGPFTREVHRVARLISESVSR